MIGNAIRSCFIGSAVLLGGTLSSSLVLAQSPSERPVAELSATVSSEVRQDQVQVVLAAEMQDDSATNVNRRLSEVVEQARKRLGSPQSVRITTGALQTYPRYDQDGRIVGWQGRAELILRSGDVLTVASSADNVTDLLAVSGVSFSLSDIARRAEQSRLMDSVAQAFREKATTTARVFGFSGFQIKSLTVSDSGESIAHRTMMMSAMASDTAEKASLTLLPGVQTVSVTVTGLVELR